MQSNGFCLLGALVLTCASVGAQQWDWVQRFSADSAGTAIGMDPSGNVYVAGSFTGTNHLGTNQFISAGGSDVFLLKLNSDGQVVWTLTTGGADNESIFRIVVTTNGALFLIGDFTVTASLVPESQANGAGDVSHVRFARLDAGRFTWIHTNMSPTGLTESSDGSLWVAAYQEGIVTAHYSQDGELLELKRFPSEDLPSGRIVSDAQGNAFFSTTFSGDVVIGTNRLHSNYGVAQVTAGLGADDVRWFWSASLGYRSYATDLVPIPNGVVSIGYIENSIAPYRSAFIAKHSSDGQLLWLRSRDSWPCTKYYFIPTAVSAAPNGNILVAGAAWPCLAGYNEHSHLWLLTLNPNGETISEHFMRTSADRLTPEAVTPKLAIAGNADGAVVLTGKAPGAFQFGTNASGGGLNAFVLWRSTLAPILSRQQVGSHIVLSWPRTAIPFVLQQSDGTGTNWSLVSERPLLVNGSWQVTLPSDTATGMFRLERTSEAPIRHVPRWTQFYGPSQAFFSHTNVVFPNSRLVFTARCQDLDDEVITFSWRDASTGEPFAGIATSVHAGRQWSYGYEYPPVDEASLVLEPVPLDSGFHTIQVIASDGALAATNSWTFELIGEETALQEFLAAIEPLRTDRVGRKAIASLEGYIRARDKERNKLAGRRWVHFQRQLARVTSLSDEELARLSASAELVKSLL